MSDGLLAVHIFAGGHGVERHGDVPVVGSADHNGVDIAAVEDVAIIAGGLGLRTHLFDGFEAAGLVDIARGDDFVTRESLQQLRQIHAAPTGTDQADADTIICA